MQCAAKNKKNNGWLAVTACILMLGVMGFAVTASAQVRPQASASVIRDFARVSFTHAAPLKLRNAVKGRQIRLRFDKPVEISAAPLLKKLKPYVISISQSNDKRSLLITTNREYRIRSFVSGKNTGIDIIGLQKGGTQAAVKKKTPPAKKTNAKPKKRTEAPKKKVPAKKTPLPKARPSFKPTPPKPVVIEKPKVPVAAPALTPEPKKAVQVKLKTEPPKINPLLPKVEPELVVEAPSAPEPEPVIETKPEPTPAPVVKTKPEPVSASAPLAAGEEKVALVEQPKQVAAPVAPVTVVEEETTKEVTLTAAPESPLPGDAIKVEALEDGIALTFPWDKRVAATVFRRANRTLILFNEQKAFNLSQLRANIHVKNVKTNQISGLTSSQLWVIETPLKGIHVSRKEKSYAWRIELLPEEKLPKKLLRLQPKVEPPLKPHLFVPVLEMASPFKFYDPLIGDQLTAIPFYEAGTGLVPPRRFAEFYMPSTAQGLIIQDAIPELRIARTRSGVKVTAPGGILLSKDILQVQLPDPEIEDSEAADSFFPYQNWQAPVDEPDAAVFEGRLWRQAAEQDKKKKRIARKRLAELYLSQGKAVEAKTLLQNLATDSPVYFTRNKMHALLGAAHFLSYEFPQAETAFKHATIEKEEELDFWRDILNVILRGEGRADYQSNHARYISHYPPVMRQRLALIAADHLINNKRYNKALKIFDTLHKDHMLEDVKDHVEFLIARVLAGTTQKDAARLMWGRLAQKMHNRYIRPRALFAIANLNLAENKISIEEAIAQLEPIRIIWRGDQFEITLLNLLTRLYEEVGQHREALRAYREIITYFPNYPKNIEITGKMADIFRKLFNEGAADKLTPLQALALYYEFRNLTPIGDEGDKMIQNLADRLTGVELLDRASSLLQHQVEFRLSGEQRSRVGARLALIHLLRRKPKEALKVLELTGYGGNPYSLQHQRSLLTARALMGVDKADRAIALLEGDDTRDAKLLQLSLHWKEQNWQEVTKVAEGLMGQREDPSLPLSAAETDVLMKLAIGYVFEQQRGQLQYLRDYFAPLIPDKKSKDLFAFITEDTKLDYRNIAKLTAQIGRMESFLATYREKIKEEGLSQAVQ
ncbi:MAG: hypothetical protein P8P30_00685 [Rickettsiales bacterium]|nr:hypothetical protein [Rickettsiales bacterium]